jgi:hypothetical protein
MIIRIRPRGDYSRLVDTARGRPRHYVNTRSLSILKRLRHGSARFMFHLELSSRRENARGMTRNDDHANSDASRLSRLNPPGSLNFSEEFHVFNGGAEIAFGTSAGVTGNEEMTNSRDPSLRACSLDARFRCPFRAFLCLISHRFKDIP